MAIQRRRRQPARGSGGGTGAANALDQLMKSIMPMMMMGLQYQQRGREDAASRAARAQEARLGRTFQERMADKRQGWAEDATRADLEQQGRKWMADQIDPTTTEADIADLVSRAETRYGATPPGPHMVVPPERRLEAAKAEIGGWTDEAFDPGALSAIQDKYFLGPMEEPQQGPVQPDVVTKEIVPLGKQESYVGQELYNAEAGRQAQLEAGFLREAELAAHKERLIEPIHQEGRERLRQIDIQNQFTRDALAQAAEIGKPVQRTVSGAGLDIDYPYLDEANQLNALRAGWVGSFDIQASGVAGIPFLTNIVPFGQIEDAADLYTMHTRRNLAGQEVRAPQTPQDLEALRAKYPEAEAQADQAVLLELQRRAGQMGGGPGGYIGLPPWTPEIEPPQFFAPRSRPLSGRR